jgi:alpha-tubulin suppressor-like RCC1 family protein
MGATGQRRKWAWKRTPGRRRLRRAVLHCPGGFLFACAITAATVGCGTEPTEPVVPARLEVSPATIFFESLGDSTRFAVRALSERGVEVPGVAAVYHSTAEHVARVDFGGTVVAVGEGKASILVTAGNLSASASVEVRQRMVRVEVTPAQLLLKSAGEAARLTATARDARGNAMAGGTAAWSGGSSAVATVDGAGLVTAVDDGQTTVVAVMASFADTVPVTVHREVASLVLPGDTIRFDALGDTTRPALGARDAGGTVIASPVVTWASSDTSVLHATEAGGVVSVGNGVAAVLARSGAASATRYARVLQRPTALRFTREPSSFIVTGEALGTFTVEARDRRGQLVRAPEVQISLGLTPSLNPGRLSGTTRATVADGVAVFESVTIDWSGAAYRLTATHEEVSTVSARVDVAIHFASLRGSASSYCGRDDHGINWCWGLNNMGQLGTDDTANRALPTRVVRLEEFGTYQLGPGVGCGITAGGSTRCWGGYFGPAGETVPVNALVTLSDGLGPDHQCGLTATGTALCWGFNSYGGRGTGVVMHLPTRTPSTVVGNHAFERLASGDRWSCGIRTDGVLLCWGLNSKGQLGIGTSTSTATPTPVAATLRFRDVQAGAWDFTCALDTAGGAWCWGDNSQSQLADAGDAEFVTTPLRVPADVTFTDLVVGGNHGCGLDPIGRAYCWGENFYGGLGNGTLEGHADLASPVVTSERFVDLAGSGYSNCGLTGRGLVFCWGSGWYDNGSFGSRNFNPRVVRLNTVVP